jgi:hypothetical protein
MVNGWLFNRGAIEQNAVTNRYFQGLAGENAHSPRKRAQRGHRG